MRSLAAVLLLVASAYAQKYAQPEVYGPPTPYTYGYSTQDVEGELLVIENCPHRCAIRTHPQFTVSPT